MPALLRNLLTLLLLAGSCLPLAANALPWERLLVQQKEALAPLSETWNTLSDKQQSNFLSYRQALSASDARNISSVCTNGWRHGAN